MSVQMWPTRSPVVRGVPRALLLIALSWALLVSPATNVASNLFVDLIQTSMPTAIGIGGRGDPTSSNIQAKLNGTVVPPGYFYDPINYPASIQLSASTAISGPKVYNEILTKPTPTLVIGYSEGTLGAEFAKRQLLANGTGPAASQLSFIMIGSPFAGNGGIFERFPGISVPFIVDNMGPAAPSAYDTTYYTREYDPYADFPAYFNPLTLANSLLGVVYAHPDSYYDSHIPGTTPAITTVVPDNGAGGTDTYVFINNPQLPLLMPLRVGAGAIGLTPLVKPLLDAVEPLLRVLVDMGYTDRVNANPAAKTPFSLLTPLSKIIEAINAIPGALQEGANNFVTDVRAELHLPPLAATPPVSPPVAPAVSPLDTSGKKLAALAPVAATADDKTTPVTSKTDEKTDVKADVKVDVKVDQTVDQKVTEKAVDKSGTPSDPEPKPTGSGEPKVKSPTPQADPHVPPTKSTKPKDDPDAPQVKVTKPKKKNNAPTADADTPNKSTKAGTTNGTKDATKSEPDHAAAA